MAYSQAFLLEGAFSHESLALNWNDVLSHSINASNLLNKEHVDTFWFPVYISKSYDLINHIL